MRWGLEQADREGLDTYLEASPMGTRLYEKNGFEVLRAVPLDLNRWGGEEVVDHLVSALAIVLVLRSMIWVLTSSM